MANKSLMRDDTGRLSTLRIAGLYIGTVVGAGFASGQEVLQFFGFYGVSGILGIGLAALLFAAYGTIILVLGHRLQARSHLEVVGASGIPGVKWVVDAVVTLFLLGAFSAMAAGSGAVFAEEFGVPALWGNLGMVAISVATVLMGIRGVVTAISLIAPFLVGAVLLVSILTVVNNPIDWSWAQPASAAVGGWPLSAITYASYNLVFAIAILAPAGRLADEGVLRKGALLGGGALGLTALAIHLALLAGIPETAQLEVPMVYLAKGVLGPLSTVYGAILLMEVYSTAIASLYGFVARITDPEGSRFTLMVIAAGAVGFVGSLIGFSEIVSKVYAAVGFAGYALLVTMLIAYVRSNR